MCVHVSAGIIAFITQGIAAQRELLSVSPLCMWEEILTLLTPEMAKPLNLNPLLTLFYLTLPCSPVI